MAFNNFGVSPNKDTLQVQALYLAVLTDFDALLEEIKKQLDRPTDHRRRGIRKFYGTKDRSDVLRISDVMTEHKGKNQSIVNAVQMDGTDAQERAILLIAKDIFSDLCLLVGQLLVVSITFVAFLSTF
jgi:hypothetical protein